MGDFVYNVDAYATLVAIAQAMGFYNQATGQIEFYGPVAGGGGYFMNHVGVWANPDALTPEPGEWGRLRINGASNFITQLKAVVAQNGYALVVYEFDKDMGAWTVDGVTPAPAWIATVALIA